MKTLSEAELKNLTEMNFPSYWYRDGGITETKALASGVRLLTGWCS